MKRFCVLVVASASLLGFAGCKSAYVDADVKNATGGPLTVFEVDYPSASFGRESVPAGSEFHYRFKVLGSGDVTATWSDAKHATHTVKGPRVWEGQQGSLVIALQPDGTVRWGRNLTPSQ